MYICQWPETCKLKFKVWALNFLSVYTFLWCFLFPLIEERLKGKTEEAKILLYSEKEHEKYTKTEMHESFSTSGSRPSDHCGFKTDAQSLPSLFDSSDLLETVYEMLQSDGGHDEGLRGGWDVMSRNDFVEFLHIYWITKIGVLIKART